MIYKHKFFSIDEKLKKVFDENGKELRLTGNAFRVLVFLCKNKSANLTQIGEELDRAKDYNEDHIRQYRYKINSIVGSEVMKYENKIYFIDGDIELKDKEQPVITKDVDRNTDLLRSFFYNHKMNVKITVISISVIALIALLAWFKPGCDIKGNISSSGEKIYHLVDGEFYDKTKIDQSKGEKWFCSEDDAIKAGWRKSKK